MVPGFSLTKWYMDVVADDGETLVAYAAEVRFAQLSLAYAGMLHLRGGHLRHASSLRRAPPKLEDRRVTWASRALGLRGEWNAELEETREPLLETDEGRVDWRCVMPLARVEVDVDGRSVRGYGYVEELTLTLAPWDLPLKELHWGRFTAEGASVVWLDWRGPHDKKVILKDGARVIGLVEDRRVDMPDADTRVLLEDGATLRDGPLAGGALAAIAELHPILPAKLLTIEEHKVVCPARLEAPDAPPQRGWAIHEVVRWK